MNVYAELEDYLPQLRTYRAHRFVSGVDVRGYATQAVELARVLYNDQLYSGSSNISSRPGAPRPYRPYDYQSAPRLLGSSWQDYCIKAPYLPQWEEGSDWSQFQLQFGCSAAYAFYLHGLCLPHAGEMLLVGRPEGVYVEVQSRFFPAYKYFDYFIFALDDFYGLKSTQPPKTATEVLVEMRGAPPPKKPKRRKRLVRDRIAQVGRLKTEDESITDAELAYKMRCTQDEAKYARQQWEQEKPSFP